MEVTIFKSNLWKLEQQIKKLQKVAKKLNVEAPTLKVLEEKIVVWGSDLYVGENKVLSAGTPVARLTVEVTGPQPIIKGWNFLATIQHSKNGNVIRRINSEVEVDTTIYRSATVKCDHCNTDRRRNDTYLVQNVKGELKQVGKSCLKDFVGGHKTAEFFANLANIFNDFNLGDEIDEECFGRGYFCPAVAPMEFLSKVCALTSAVGYVTGKNATPKNPATAQVVWGNMVSPLGDSIDLSEKDKEGISIKRYLMKKIKLAIPEVAQIKDLVDDPSINPLKEELDRSKKTRKKGLKTFDYYKVEVTFDVDGEIQGFIPNQEDVLMHYRNGEGIIFYHYHFKNWFRTNLPLINRSSSSIGDMRFFTGKVIMNGQKTKIIEKYVTNIDSGFSSSRGTGGRGTRKAEVLVQGMKVTTAFSFPRDLISPDKIQKAFDIICENGSSFGGNHKLSTGRLVNPKVNIVSNALWEDD